MDTRYPLTEETLDALGRDPPAPGRTVYILEALRGSEYGPARVALAHRALRDALAGHEAGRYPTFRYQEYASPEAAYAAACRIYHDLGGELGHLENRDHPHPPPDRVWPCPVPGCPRHWA